MADIRLLTEEKGYSLGNLALPPNNEILLDNAGKPSVMVKIPKFTLSDIGMSGGTHPAFIVNGVEKPYIYISKYQNIVDGGKAYSLPYQQPAIMCTFDQAKAVCEAKGNGWHLMTNAEWAAIALWCKKHNCMPYGNNNYNYGDYYYPEQKGAPKPYRYYYDPQDPSQGYEDYPLTATGSGPKDWFHNKDFSGIADLNGNVYEWVGGLRLVDGEIQVIQNNDAAMQVDQSATSTLWKAILQNNTLVAPGTASTLKYTSVSGLKVGTTKTGTGAGGTFKTIAADTSVTIPVKLKDLALFPADATAANYRDDYFYASLSGERLCYRGGSYDDDGYAGVFCAYLNDARSTAYDYLGFRSAFVNL